jgi:hypothetical protein
MITYLKIYVWEIDNFLIKSDINEGFFTFKNILNTIIVLQMTTTFNTSCSENIMVFKFL